MNLISSSDNGDLKGVCTSMLLFVCCVFHTIISSLHYCTGRMPLRLENSRR
jgi:hypothetical protein